MKRSIKQVELKRSSSVSLWTPWGVQSVPKQDFRTAAMKRLAGRLATAPKSRDGKVLQT